MAGVASSGVAVDEARMPGSESSPLLVALRAGQSDAALLLLAAGCVDPAAEDNLPVKTAAGKGLVDVVARLLLDSRVDASACSNAAIRDAAAAGHDGVISLLLTDVEVRRSGGLRAALHSAAKSGSLAVLNQLLDHKLCDARLDGSAALIYAAHAGQPALVERLLADPGINSAISGVLASELLFGDEHVCAAAAEMQRKCKDADIIDDCNSRIMMPGMEALHAFLDSIMVRRGVKDMALHVAAAFGHVTVMDVLLKPSPDAPISDIRNCAEATAAAVAANQLASVRRLLADDLGRSALRESYQFAQVTVCLAAARGQVDTLQLLLSCIIPAAAPQAEDTGSHRDAAPAGAATLESAVTDTVSRRASGDDSTRVDATVTAGAGAGAATSATRSGLSRSRLDHLLGEALAIASFGGHDAVVEELVRHLPGRALSAEDRAVTLFAAVGGRHLTGTARGTVISERLRKHHEQLHARDDPQAAAKCLAEERKRAAIVRCLLREYRGEDADLTESSEQLLAAAVSSFCGAAVLAALLEDAWLHAYILSDASCAAYLARRAVLAGNIVAIDILLSLPFPDENFASLAKEAMITAAEHGHRRIMERLLAHERVDVVSLGARALRRAVMEGNAAIVELLLADARIDPNHRHPFEEEAISFACEGGHDEVVAALLADDRVFVCEEFCRPLRRAARGGHLAIVQRLLERLLAMPASPSDARALAGGRAGPRVARTRSVRYAIHIAAARGHLTIVGALLGALATLAQVDRRDDSEYGLAVEELEPGLEDQNSLADAVIVAARRGHVAVVDSLLCDALVQFVDPTGSALRGAAQRGHCATVERLLLDARVNPALTDGSSVTALEAAASQGHLEIVLRLMADSRLGVQPLAIFDQALRQAAVNGHISVVKHLLADPRVNPAVDDNAAIVGAAAGGHCGVVERLLADPRVDPAALDNRALQMVARSGHPAVVELLLADARVDPAADDNGAIVGAAAFGRLAVVQRLLADPRVDPAARNNAAIREACRGGCVAVVDRLLADPRVDPAADEGALALAVACEARKIGVVKRLLDDPRVDPSANGNRALRMAARAGEDALLARLLSDDRVDPLCRGRRGLDALASVSESFLATLTPDSSTSQTADLTAVARRLMLLPSVLHSLERRLSAPPPSALWLPDDPIDIAAVAAAAWQRRRAVVLSREVMLRADHHDDL